MTNIHLYSNQLSPQISTVYNTGKNGLFLASQDKRVLKQQLECLFTLEHLINDRDCLLERIINSDNSINQDSIGKAIAYDRSLRKYTRGLLFFLTGYERDCLHILNSSFHELFEGRPYIFKNDLIEAIEKLRSAISDKDI